MSFLTVGHENSEAIRIYYEDHGSGAPVTWQSMAPGASGPRPCWHPCHVSDQAWQNSFHVAIRASARATLGCAAAWLEDFRGDLPRIDVPVLVVQGSQDRILLPEATGDRLPALIRDVRRVVIEGGPHAIIWTHAGQVNQALLDFIPLTGTP